MSDHRRFTRLRRVLKGCCTFGLIAIPALFAAVWWQFEWLAANAPELRTLPIHPEAIGTGTRFLGFLVSMVPASLVLYGLWRLRGTFNRFAEGEVFSAYTIAGIRTFALMVVLQAVIRPVASALLTVLLTMANPPGQRMLAISFGSGQVETLFVGAVFFVVAHLMAEGRRLADENALIV